MLAFYCFFFFCLILNYFSDFSNKNSFKTVMFSPAASLFLLQTYLNEHYAEHFTDLFVATFFCWVRGALYRKWHVWQQLSPEMTRAWELIHVNSFLLFAGFFPNSPTCSTRKVLITLDAPRYQYFPYFVEVYRCNGVCSTVSPNLQQCLAAAWNNITGAVLDLSSKSLKTVTVQNHTNCKCACVAKKEDCSENEEFNEGNCQCNCKYTDQPPSPCPAGFRSVWISLRLNFTSFYLIFLQAITYQGSGSREER